MLILLLRVGLVGRAAKEAVSKFQALFQRFRIVGSVLRVCTCALGRFGFRNLIWAVA